MVAKKTKKGTKRIKDLSVKSRSVRGGSFNGFVNFGDIKGESKDKDHKDWITMVSPGSGVTSPGFVTRKR